jgi:predicted lipoprotein
LGLNQPLGERVPSEAVQVAEPALSTLAQTVLGSVLILALLLAVLAVYTLIKIQNARVDDQKEMSGRLEASHAKMLEAFSKFKITIEGLERTEATGQQVLQAVRDQLVALATRIDGCPRRGA